MPRNPAKRGQIHWMWRNNCYQPFRHGARKEYPKRYAGKKRWTKNFRGSLKQQFIHTVVARIGLTYWFHDKVREYTGRCTPLAAAYVLALQDIPEQLAEYGPEFEIDDTPEFEVVHGKPRSRKAKKGQDQLRSDREGVQGEARADEDGAAGLGVQPCGPGPDEDPAG